MAKKKVVVGMSGGVDSSVAAYLLKEQGYDVIGVTMQIWQDEESKIQEENGGCCGLSAVDDARKVAAQIGIPYYVMNFKKDFQEKVIDYFVDEYLHGRTPNPCIACNRYVKWESLLTRSMEIGADYIATGHYARVEQLPNGRYAIRHSATWSKDQTYALYNLTQDQLRRTLMPVGEYEKDQIREIAKEIGLQIANKPDSQDICFVSDDDYASFIEEESNQKIPEGNFVTPDGKILGRHKGIIHYTIGQRRGLGIAAEAPLYVCGIDVPRNEVVLGRNDDLFSTELDASGCNWISGDVPQQPLRVTARIRYRQPEQPCTVTVTGADTVHVSFETPQRAITRGQAVVFYDGDTVLGGGTID